jgi:hypothetical protein
VEITSVVGLFNFVNRFNDSLGVLPDVKWEKFSRYSCASSWKKSLLFLNLKSILLFFEIEISDFLVFKFTVSKLFFSEMW